MAVPLSWLLGRVFRIHLLGTGTLPAAVSPRQTQSSLPASSTPPFLSLPSPDMPWLNAVSPRYEISRAEVWHAKFKGPIRCFKLRNLAV